MRRRRLLTHRIQVFRAVRLPDVSDSRQRGSAQFERFDIKHLSIHISAGWRMNNPILFSIRQFLQTTIQEDRSAVCNYHCRTNHSRPLLLITTGCFEVRSNSPTITFNHNFRFCEDVVWAAGFATNIHTVLEDNDYFAEVN